MKLFAEIEYAKQLQYRLNLPKIISRRPFKLNARCPICGDSKKNPHLTRFWINEVKHKGDIYLRCSCFNCGYNQPLYSYLKDNEPSLFNDYRIELFKEANNKTRPEPVKEPEKKPLKVVPKEEEESIFWKVPDLPEDHVIRKYLKKRCIPESVWHLLGFTMTFRKLSQYLRPDLYPYELKDDHPRLIIPIYNKDGLVALQGRALTKNHDQKYITIKVDPDFDKIYGTERVVDGLDVIFVEGPIDSLFLNNGCAIVGGSVQVANAPYKGRRIWALDNERYHKDVVQRMETLLKAGERVVIWDRLPRDIIDKKDINNFVECGYSTEFIETYIRENAVSGLMGMQRFKKWKKI